MEFVDEYRSAGLARFWLDRIRARCTRPWTIMEICGGQTHTIVRSGLEEMLPGGIRLVHGPGCPVCVTPVETIDRAVAIARQGGVTLASFGDMLRVPGSTGDLLGVKSEGGDVRIVYSPLDALALARKSPSRKVVFLAVGFETTAPACAMSVWLARREEIANYSILCAHVLVPPAIRTILSAPGNRVQGFLAAGHVCTVMGTEEYEPMAAEFRVPIVVTGFEPADILQGVAMAVGQLETGACRVENQYSRCVTRRGNLRAQALMREVFEPADRAWRGIGVIRAGGLRLREEYASFDAERLYGVEDIRPGESPLCIAGLVLQGLKRPAECPAFASECTPEHPLGAPMVSSEGACAAYFAYGRRHSG
ncbi:MAG: hydrogenase formation protein HypD [Bacteroidota bacterium]